MDFCLCEENGDPFFIPRASCIHNSLMCVKTIKIYDSLEILNIFCNNKMFLILEEVEGVQTCFITPNDNV